MALQIGRWTVHASITEERVCTAAEARMTTLENPGFCLACGEDAMGVEPDAEGYECEICGENAVYGAEQVLLHMVV